MSAVWTPEAVLALAPDSGSAKAAQGLASSRQWESLGRHGFALWGEIKGSGSKPYQSRIDLREPAFKCSCPSRKFPCKHGLALLLVFAAEAKAFQEAEPPGWVGDWVAGRDQRSEKRSEKAAGAAVVDEEARERRTAQRESRIGAGVEQVGLWLGDLLRTGLAGAQAQPASYWAGMAARLVDAQAPGLARLVRQLEELMHSGPGWESRLLHGVCRLELIRRAYVNRSALTPDLVHEVRTAVGWTQSQEDVLAQPGVRDRWRVLGSVLEAEDRLRVRRTWLCGKQSKRPALLLDFAAGTQALDAGLPAGCEVDAELAFYPGTLALRALIKTQAAPVPCTEPLPGSDSLEQALSDYAQALGRAPWLERWPMTLSAVKAQPGWFLVDGANARVALPPRFAQGWHLLAASGGGPLDVFGEWDGEYLLPLTVATAGGLYSVGTGLVPQQRRAA
jgi:hypothetical protein